MDAIIAARQVSKHFGPIRAVDRLDLSVAPGEIYGLLGPNGSGKTTLIRLIIGLLRPTSGHVTVLGHVMPHKPTLAAVGYMTQAGALYEDLSVRENVTFFAQLCGLRDAGARVRDVVALADLSDLPQESRRRHLGLRLHRRPRSAVPAALHFYRH